MPGEEWRQRPASPRQNTGQLKPLACLQVQRRATASSSGLAARRPARPARALRPLLTRAAAAAGEAPVLPFRVGHGWDLHRLEPGYPLIIGGIDIPHDRGCVAHSDGAAAAVLGSRQQATLPPALSLCGIASEALQHNQRRTSAQRSPPVPRPLPPFRPPPPPGDVLLHTVVDAILGALCLPDIGQIFPDTDPKWRGARSDIFLKEAVSERPRGGGGSRRQPFGRGRRVGAAQLPTPRAPRAASASSP